MITAAKKSSPTTSSSLQTTGQPFFSRAGGGDFFAPAHSVPQIQMKMTANKPGDKFEKEADGMADRVMRMPAPVSSGREEKIQRKEGERLQKKADEKIQKAPAGEEKLQRDGSGVPAVAASTQTMIRNKTGGGQPLSGDVRSFMESRFHTDFSNVRIHNDAESGRLSGHLSARAFTHRNHIFFSRGQYNPGTSEGRQLLAHELTHTIQQGHAIQRGPQIGTTTTPPHIQREESNGSLFDRAGSAVGGFFSGAGRVIGGAVRSVAAFGANIGWSLLERYAPELIPIIRQGPINWLRGRITGAVQTIFNTLMAPIRTVTGLASSLNGHFSNLINWVRHSASRIARGDCGAIREGVERIQEVFEGLAAPVVDRIKDLAKRAKGFFDGLWERFGAPVWQFLQQLGGQAWEQIQRFGRWVWEKMEPVRSTVSEAWTWFKNLLGIGEGPDGQDGIFQWIQRQAQMVWDEYIKPFYERYRTQILIVAGILVMLSPAGPFIAVGAAVAALAAGIRWMRQHLSSSDGVVQQRDALRRIIIPGILRSIQSFSSFIMEKARWIADRLTGLMAGLNSALGAVAGTILGFVVGLLQSLVNGFQELVHWATQKLMELANGIVTTLQGFAAFLQPVLNFFGEIARTIGDIMRLPLLLAGQLWNRIPACIRNPFVDFFIPLILRQIPFFSELAATPEAWRQTQADVMRLIRQVFQTFDLMGAIRSVFALIVRVLRIPVDLMAQLLDKAAQAWDAVIAAPLRFIENALKAILQGMGRFITNILSHLWFGVQGWLLNAVSQSGVAPPASWTFQALFAFVLDVMGISVDHIIDLIDRRVPGAGRPLRGAVRLLTGAMEWLRIAIEEGPRGLWNHLVESLGNLGNMILESAIGWVMQRIMVIVSARITAMAASGGLSAVLEAVQAIYSALRTAIEYMPRIIGIFITVFDTVTQIASGVISPAAEMVERGMRMAMPVVIGFLANYAGLGGIGERVREIILDIRQRVDNAILGLIDRVIATIRRLYEQLRRGVQAIREWWRARRAFRTNDGQSHSIFLEGAPPGTRVVVQSRRSFYSEVISQIENIDLRTRAVELNREMQSLMGDISREGANQEVLHAQLETKLNDMSNVLIQAGVLDSTELPRPQYSFVLESGKASIATVTNLSANRPNGSEPFENPQGWEFLENTRQVHGQGGLNFVRMHLINHNFGGPGTRNNLAPGPNRRNGEHLRNVENPIKMLVGDVPMMGDKRAVVNYRVSVQYTAGEEILQQNPIVRLSDFPKKFICTWDWKASPATPDSEKTVAPTVAVDIDPPRMN